MYDWANSAFYTTVVGTLFSPYITRLAQSAVGENGVVLDLGPLGAVTAKSLPTLCVSISVGAQVFPSQCSEQSATTRISKSD